MSDFSVRRALASDAATIAALRVAFLQEEGVDIADALALHNEFESYLARTLGSGDVVAWLAETDAGVAGTGVVTIYERMTWNGVRREGYVLNMYTVPAARRRGIGSAIVDELVAFARAEGLRLALIATDEGRPLYERVGFKHDDRYMRWR